MSERMIELQRAKLMGLQPQSTAQSPKPSPNSTAVRQQTPEEAAAATLLSEDAQMERFINRLQRRDDTNPIFEGDAMGSSRGPTVPTALSRRMLQRQGVGYLDNTVAAVVSASADRFLATVLQQGIACRDQRLKGAAMSREAAKHRKRHMQHYEADTDDRKRRRELIENARQAVAENAMTKADLARKGGAGKAATTPTKSGDAKSKKKNKKKVEEETSAVNGTKLDPAVQKLAEEEDEEEYDSIDEEEEYYQENVGEIEGGHGAAGDQEDEEEEDDTLLLKDIVRPLEAWNFHLTGKEAFESDEEESDEEEDDNDGVDGAKGDVSVAPTEDNGNEDSMALASGTDGNRSEGQRDDDGDNDGKKSVATSPGGPSS